jgi:hypothetical protein
MLLVEFPGWIYPQKGRADHGSVDGGSRLICLPPIAEEQRKAGGLTAHTLFYLIRGALVRFEYLDVGFR